MKTIKTIVHVLRLVVKYGAFVMAVVTGIKATIAELEKDGLIDQQR